MTGTSIRSPRSNAGCTNITIILPAVVGSAPFFQQSLRRSLASGWDRSNFRQSLKPHTPFIVTLFHDVVSPRHSRFRRCHACGRLGSFGQGPHHPLLGLLQDLLRLGGQGESPMGPMQVLVSSSNPTNACRPRYLSQFSPVTTARTRSSMPTRRAVAMAAAPLHAPTTRPGPSTTTWHTALRPLP